MDGVDPAAPASEIPSSDPAGRAQPNSPQQVHQAALPGDGGLHPVGKLDCVLLCLQEGTHASPRAGRGAQSAGGPRRGLGTHLSGHWGQVPHAADDGPAGHHPEQVGHHPVLAAVPEGVPKLWVILKGDRAGGGCVCTRVQKCVNSVCASTVSTRLYTCACVFVWISCVCVCVCKQQPFRNTTPHLGARSAGGHGSPPHDLNTPQEAHPGHHWPPAASASSAEQGGGPTPAASSLSHGHLASTLSVLKPTPHRGWDRSSIDQAPRQPPPESPRLLLQPNPSTSHTHKHFDTQLPREKETSLHDGQPSKPTSEAQTQEQTTRELCFCPTVRSRRGHAGTETLPGGVPVGCCPLPSPLVEAPARDTSWETRPLL